MGEALFNEPHKRICEGEERLKETERGEERDQCPPERVEEDAVTRWSENRGVSLRISRGAMFRSLPLSAIMVW